MLVDTHCHLSIEPLHQRLMAIIESGKSVGVSYFISPGVDVVSSQKASEIALAHEEIYAAVGIHPEIVTDETKLDIEAEVKKIELLLGSKKIVAIGEVGLDRHMYTHYAGLTDTSRINQLIEVQKTLLKKQIAVATKYNLSVILHSRDTAEDMLDVLNAVWEGSFKDRFVLHCCEVSEVLLSFAKEKGVFIGVDGDISWSKKKQRFIKEVPLDLLVLETDSPYLTPEPVKKEQQFPNEPKNIVYVRDVVASIRGISKKEVEEQTTENAKKLFRI